MSSEKCDNDVFNNGISLGFFDMSKQEAEQFCIDKSKETGDQYDWHYFAGRVVVKYLPKNKE